ncbi:MAG TPA: DinB family protein [Bacteroidetes bacterium]|nr:DinB family protein [Bacteroidota bacterium]
MQISHTIAEMFDYSYKFNLYYLNKLDPKRLHEPLITNGETGNSAYWLLGHLLWGEAEVVMEVLGETPLPIPWVRHFAMKIRKQEVKDLPDFQALVKEMDRVHTLAMEMIRKQSDEDLQLPAFVQPANWHTIRKKALYHTIRHQSFHTGQLALIAKSHGAETP